MTLPFDPLPMLNIAVLTLLLVVAFAVIRTRDLLASVILFGIFSLLMALMYLIMQAPDVAITEAAVGAGISTLVFLAAIVFTGRENTGPSHRSRPLPILMVTALGLALAYTTADMPHFGDPNAPANLHVAPYYITQTQSETNVPNIVTGVLASYRGYDTMGETFVVFTALLAVSLLLGGTLPDRRSKP